MQPPCREAPIRAREAVARYKAELGDAKANILNQARDVEVADHLNRGLAKPRLCLCWTISSPGHMPLTMKEPRIAGTGGVKP